MAYATGKIYGTGFPCTGGGLRFEMYNVEIGDHKATGRVCYFTPPRVKKNGEIYASDKYITGNMLVYNDFEPHVICLDHAKIDATACGYGKIIAFTFEGMKLVKHPYAEIIEGLKEGANA